MKSIIYFWAWKRASKGKSWWLYRRVCASITAKKHFERRNWKRFWPWALRIFVWPSAEHAGLPRDADDAQAQPS